jgi:vacuolar-type H+-ATPase subunit H
MQGLYAPTQEDLEAIQYNRAQEQFSNSIAGIIAHIPQMRKQKKTQSYWRQRDAAFNAPIQVGAGGALQMAPDALNSFKFGTQTDEWNRYKDYMDSKGVRLGENDYQMFTQAYELKKKQYAEELAAKFYSMESHGVSKNKIRDLVVGNDNIRDSLIKLSVGNPDLEEQFRVYTTPRQGLAGGLAQAAPKAAMAGLAMQSIPLSIMGGKFAYEKAMGKETSLKKDLRTTYLQPFKPLKDKFIKSETLKKEGKFKTKPKEATKKQKAAVQDAKNKLNKLKTKAGKFKKNVTQKTIKSRQSALKKAENIVKKAKKPGKKMTAGQVTTKLKNTLRTGGVKGVYKLLSKNLGKRAAIGLMARVGLGTAASFTGAGTALGVGMNLWTATTIARQLSKAMNEVPADASFSEKLLGKETTTMEGQTF